jgi:hypothetical protein
VDGCIYTGISHTDAEVVQNDDLKNLMMSWYYAGYYTGLFEGKQQGYSMAQQQQQPSTG